MKTVWILAGAGAAAVVGWLVIRPKTTSGPAATVYHRERADGVDPRLQSFLDAWAQSGPFDIVVAPQGGVRTDEAAQEKLYASGASRARTLGETPHGRGGAVDVAPIFDGVIDWDTWSNFQAIGEFAEGMGLTWGGRFTTIRDGDHIEVADWRDLPLPGGVA